MHQIGNHVDNDHRKERSIRISRIDSYITRMRDVQKIEESYKKNKNENTFFCKLIKYVK